MHIHKLTPLEQLNPKGRHASFVAFTTEITLSDNYGDQSGQKVPVVMMTQRWDGKKGFIGGNVDNDESILEATIRETKEETGYQVELSDKDYIASCTFKAGRTDLTTSIFLKQVSEDTFKEIMHMHISSKNFFDEGFGLVAIPLANFKNNQKGLINFIKTPMSSSVLEELYILCNILAADVYCTLPLLENTKDLV